MKRLLKIILWLCISIAGAGSVAVMALHRGEPLNALWLVVAGLCTFAVAYRFYGAWLTAKVLTVDTHRAPPAVTKADGKDYVPTHKWVVFGHHFAAIAGPGPLVGPVLAAQFGYLPGALWILIGATLGGAVHDAIVLFASMRREGKSLGQMLREEINPIVGMVAMLSILAIITILLAVLGLIVVNTLAHSPWGLFTIAATIPLAIVMGLGMKTGRFSVRAISLFGVIGLLVAVVAGKWLPEDMNAFLTLDKKTLCWWIIGYGFAASVLPVWLLLAPRDYLSTFMKIGTVAVLAIFIILVAPTLQMPAVTKFIDGTGMVVSGTVIPFVCITIACGAVSGFHSLICSGTTPKLASNESAVRSVGYGAMIAEMLVALMALIAACSMKPGEYFAINAPAKNKTPEMIVADVNKSLAGTGHSITVAEMEKLAKDVGEPSMFDRAGGAPTFAVGMAQIFAKVIPGSTAMSLWYHFAIMFEALFILTTLDAGTRVGRFILQDVLRLFSARLGDTRSGLGNVVASALLVAAWGYFLYQGAVDPLGGINSLWPLFGIANQLLSVIGFCLATTVIIKMRRQRYLAVTLVPLAWLLFITFSAGYQKLFGPEKMGFIATAEAAKVKLAALETSLASADPATVEGLQVSIKETKALVFNNQLNAIVAGTFLVFVSIIVIGCGRDWFRMLSGRIKIELKEGPYIPLSPDAASVR